MSVLERIIAAKREAVAQRRTSRPLERLREGLEPTTRSLRQALAAAPCGFILECKHRAPSGGVLRAAYDPAALARSYAEVANAISVLTDEPFFGGNLAHLAQVRAAVTLPVLCKDFVVEPYQLYEARRYGADAVLLMLSVLDDRLLRECLALAAGLGMDALVEVRDEAELARALDAGATLIGINNRDLATLEVRLETTERLAPRVPAGVTLVAESGIRARADVQRLRPFVDAFLVGSSLMRRSDLGRAARELAYGRFKVCGLTRVEDARAAWQAGASWGGLIFAPQSPRCLTLAQAAALREAVPELHWAGVFVDADPATVVTQATTLALDAVQLHGNEPPELLSALRGTLPTDCALWKAVGVPVAGPTINAATLPSAAALGADRVLLDSQRGGQRGGTGTSFDWRGLAALPAALRAELLLAGGLGPSNLAEAEALGLWALDLNSGVEDAPGHKSQAKLAHCAAMLRAAGGRRRGDR